MTTQRVTSATALCLNVLVWSTATAPALAQCDPRPSLLLQGKDITDLDHFGEAVDVCGDLIIVGSPGHEGNSGSVYIFDRLTRLQRRELTAPDRRPLDHFGRAVSLDGQLAAVGATDAGSLYDQGGAVYLFDALTGEFLSRIDPVGNRGRAEFGCAVDLSGDRLIVGARSDRGNAVNAGLAYLFDVSIPSRPIQIAVLMPDVGKAFDWFGTSVAIEGSLAIVGAPGHAEFGSYSGAAFLFDARSGTSIRKLTASDAERQDHFGESVALDGGLALIGAPDAELAGCAYLFDATKGEELAILRAETPGRFGEQFGCSVALSSQSGVTLAAIGARQDREHGVLSGAAYYYEVHQSAPPRQIAKIIPSDGTDFDYFGTAIAISGTSVVVGVPRADGVGRASGKAYLFEQPCRPTLSSIGSCPGTMRFKVVRASPNTRVALALALGTGELVVPPDSQCAGTLLGLDASARLVGAEFANDDGSVLFRGRLANQWCGRIFVQAIDLSDCATSDVVRID